MTDPWKGRACEQKCSRRAEVYAIDPIPNGWGGYYCEECAEALRFRVVDRRTAVRTAVSKFRGTN